MRVKWSRGMDVRGGSLRIKKSKKKQDDEFLDFVSTKSLSKEAPPDCMSSPLMMSRSSATLPCKSRVPSGDSSIKSCNTTPTKPKKEGFFRQLFSRHKRTPSSREANLEELDEDRFRIKENCQYHTSLLGRVPPVHGSSSENELEQRVLQAVVDGCNNTKRISPERPSTWCQSDSLAFIDDDEDLEDKHQKGQLPELPGTGNPAYPDLQCQTETLQQASDGDSALGDDVSAESPRSAPLVNSDKSNNHSDEHDLNNTDQVKKDLDESSIKDFKRKDIVFGSRLPVAITRPTCRVKSDVGYLPDVNQNRSRGNATVASSVGTVSSSTRIRSAQVTANKVEELSKEVQRLGALCEARTKELNMVKMQTKHTALGFDAFGVLVKYLVGELDAFSHPDLVADIQKTKEELITLESVLKQYEADVEQMKTTHSDKLNSLTEELKRSEAEILSLNNKLNDADAIRAKEVHDTVENYEFKAKEIQQMHLHSVENLKISHQREIEGLELQLKEKLEEALKRHEAEKDDLKAQIEVQKKKFLSMEQTAKAFEETLNKDTDAKIQWISAKNQELQQEVDSLKSVLDMKQQEIHALRAENMKMKKGLEELPLERHRVMKLQARNEELQALVRDKVKSEKKLSCEHRRLKEYLEQEEKFKQQLTMENEELQWKIKHSFDGSSFLNATVDGNVISLIASTPEVAEKFKNLRAMSFNPLSPFRESYEKSSPMQTSIACLEDAKKTFRNSKPKPRRPSKSCSASPRKSPSRHHLASAFVASTPGTPSAHCCHKVLDLSKLDDRGELDETLDMSGTSSRSLESPQESLTELHFKACLHIDAMEEMAQMTNTGLDPGATRALLQSPDGMSSDSGGPGGCSSLASSSVAEDGMSASVSSVEPDDKDLLAMTAESSFYSVCSPRNEARDSPFNPNAANGVNGAISPEPVESLNSVTTTSTCTNSKNSNATSYEPCFCDDFDINSEPE